MESDEDWFLEQGFLVEIEQVGAKSFSTHLVHRDNQGSPTGRVKKYGGGKTPELSIRRARNRYEVEELGIKPTS
jgi:hypothetical protein